MAEEENGVGTKPKLVVTKSLSYETAMEAELENLSPTFGESLIASTGSTGHTGEQNGGSLLKNSSGNDGYVNGNAVKMLIRAIDEKSGCDTNVENGNGTICEDLKQHNVLETDSENLYDDTAILVINEPKIQPPDQIAVGAKEIDTSQNTSEVGGQNETTPNEKSQELSQEQKDVAKELSTVSYKHADRVAESYEVATCCDHSGSASQPENKENVDEEIFYDEVYIPPEEKQLVETPALQLLPEAVYDDIDDDDKVLSEDSTQISDRVQKLSLSSGSYDHLWNLKTKPNDGVYSSVDSANTEIPENIPDSVEGMGEEPIYFEYEAKPFVRQEMEESVVSQDGDIYEPVDNVEVLHVESDSDGWGSDEFETYNDDLYQNLDVAEDFKRNDGATTNSAPPAGNGEMQGANFFSRFGNTFRSSKRADTPEDDKIYKEVDVNTEKHPPPALPEMPDGLSSKQIKRRLIVASIIESEQSYLNSVTKLVKDYKDHLLENPSTLARDKVKTIFHKVGEIRQIHLQFQIALKFQVDEWDKTEEIANVFIASFGKNIVCDVYSEFVNNFSHSMELIKEMSRQKPAFADFLKQKIINSSDKLSLFGLMVKPVQRFPQYILQLQDLLKHTPENHSDRLKLQMALTELENLAQKLNENKRESERKYAIKQILSNLKLTQKASGTENRALIRQDNMFRVEYNSNGELIKSKARRMIILSDLLVCAAVSHRESVVEAPSSGSEKYAVKWCVPIQDVEYKETAITPHMYVKITGGPGRTTVTSKEVVPVEPIALHSEVSNMVHDQVVLAQMSALASSLKLSHKNFSVELIDSIIRDLQKNLYTKNEQLKVLESSTIQLLIPSKSGTAQYFFRTATPALKRDWVLDFQAAKLAKDLKNRPAWVFPESAGHKPNLTEVPLFFKHLPIDVTRLYTTISCGLPIYIQSSHGTELELQHLWVCSSLENRGQVTLISMCSDKPHLIQSFQACDEAITCVELVNGFAMLDAPEAFAEDTVWMGTTGSRIVIHSLPNLDVSDSTRPKPKLIFSTPSPATNLKAVNDKLFVAMENGSVAIYTRTKAGIWKLKEPRISVLGSFPVTCLLLVGEQMFASCDKEIHVISTVTELKETVHTIDTEVPIQCMVRSGIGLWLALQGKPTLKLYHLETFDALQVIDIDRQVNRALLSKKRPGISIDSLKDVNVTCLFATKGLLWIGTNIGVTLTVPLPRLEGVPRIHCSPTVACHAHNGPVRFIIPICCGLSVPHIIESSVSKADTVVSPVMKSPTTPKLSTSPEIERLRLSPLSKDSDPSSQKWMQRSMSESPEPNVSPRQEQFYAYASLYKAKSTPNLTDPGDSGDYINLLYGSLMRSPNEIEFESSYSSDYVTVQASKGDVHNYRSTMSKAKGYLRGLRTKSVNITGEKDVEIEDNCLYESITALSYKGQSKQTQSGLKKVENLSNEDLTKSSNTLSKKTKLKKTKSGQKSESSSNEDLTRDDTVIKRTFPTHGPMCRSVSVVTGGDGYCNWNKVKPKDLKNSEGCLLLWQCTFPSSLSSVV